MDADIQNFVENYKKKPMPTITIQDLIKDHNHEIWRTCFDCFDHFDIKKELYYDRCPSCGSKNIK